MSCNADNHQGAVEMFWLYFGVFQIVQLYVVSS